MNIRPFAHLESTWLNQGTPCGGALCECDLDRACLAKKPVALNHEHVEGADSIADWAQPPAPAEACTDLGVESRPAPFVFPLEKHLTRHPWLGPVLVTCVVVVWTCIDAYLAVPTP